jgi:DNA methylase
MPCGRKIGIYDCCSVVCGDCLELMKAVPNGLIDAVITDPPYGISHSSNHGASWCGSEICGDNDVSSRNRMIGMLPPDIPMAVFGSYKRPPHHSTRAVLIWDKGPAFGMGDLSLPWKPSFEEIYIMGYGWEGTRDEGVIRGHLVVSWESKGRCHPNQKPVSLIEYLLSKLPKAETILDPFLGSGTTAVAAKKLGRHFLGFEISEEYCRIARERIALVENQPNLFERTEVMRQQALAYDGPDKEGALMGELDALVELELLKDSDAKPPQDNREP